MRLIINADDCGKDKKATEHIAMAINKGKVTSTTIMANMHDFEGAVALYHSCKDIASFGCHLNLTEGKPLTSSDLLQEKGFIKPTQGNAGELQFNADAFNNVRNKFLTKDVRKAIFEELDAQVTKIEDAGVKLSHLDSHHLIHTSVFMMPIIDELLRKHHLDKVRRVRNWVPSFKRRLECQVWYSLFKFFNHNVNMTNFFAFYDDLFEYQDYFKLKADSTVEVMCHPGHDNYQKEEGILLNAVYPKNIELITYNQL